jgi:hypothetical protein
LTGGLCWNPAVEVELDPPAPPFDGGGDAVT